MPSPKPYKLITVSTAPEGASRVVRRVAEDVKDRYTIIHCVNAASIDEVEPLVSLYRPDILVCEAPQATYLSINEAEGRKFKTKVSCANSNTVERMQVCLSMWSPDQSTEIKEIARATVPGMRCYVVPRDIQAERAVEGAIEHVKTHPPKIIEGGLGLK